MKLHPDAIEGPHISAYGPGWVAINGQRCTTSLLLCAQGPTQWDCTRFEDLQPSHFDAIAAMGCELVLFGSGECIRFPQPAWLQPLYARRIGFETMDTPAACRTYNFLAAEGRKVVAAILL